jgi:subtilisin-like proprotein convertase family protein
MDALHNALITQSATGTNNGVRPPHARAIGHKLTLSVLAATLALTAALPVIAGETPHKRHGHEQRQEQDVSGEARGNGNKKGGKTKAVKKTFATIGGAITVPEDTSQTNGIAGPYPSAIPVQGFKQARITDVNVTLRGFSHGFPRDLDLLLVAPDGRNAVILSDAGIDGAGAAVENLTLTLDDEAAASLTNNAAFASGTVRSFNLDTGSDAFPAPAPAASENVALSTFDGLNPNGDWQLFVLDDSPGDTGRITNGWSLEITAKAKSKKKR